MLGRLFRHTKRTFHTLIAVAFLGLSGLGVGVSFSEWRNYQRAPSLGLAEFTLVASFTVLLIIFCLYSFAKARSVR
ncbi:MAG TPA: hypothetical protein VG204_09430 [Terriglobia bacterium]|nr:hypothetical protein [Terriglobia bacterium]